MVRYTLYLLIGVILLGISFPVLNEDLSAQSITPFIALFGLGLLFREFVKRYRQQRPTTLLNFLQLGYIASLVIALYYSIVILLKLF
jgi:hypothetical protein